MHTVSLANIDRSSAIEVIASQDPEKALRVNVPIPNWLDESGNPIYKHPQIGQKPDGAWRYFFVNEKDGCAQNVEIDGKSVITFMGANPDQAARLIAVAKKYGAEAEKLTPETLTALLDEIKATLGIVDRYDNGRDGVDGYMHPYSAIQSGHKYLGAFLPNPNLSSAVYVPEEGEFIDGPAWSSQKFGNGAFISFPGLPKAQLLVMTVDELKASGQARLVQADIFVSSRTYSDGTEIDIGKLAEEPNRQPRASVTANSLKC